MNYNWLYELRATNSPIEKVDILKRNDNDFLVHVLALTYNPYLNFGITAPPLDPGFSEEKDIDSLLAELSFFSLLHTRKLTGNAAREGFADLCKNSQRYAELYTLILNRDLQAGISAKIINKAFPNLIPEFELMLCHVYDDKTAKKIRWPAYAQLKYDAARVAVIVKDGFVTYRTRNGKTYNIEKPSLDQEFLELANGRELVFDGELLQMKDGKMLDRKKSNGVATRFVRSTASKEENENAAIFIWDAVTFEEFSAGYSPTPYYQRFGLCKQAKGISVFPAETKEVHSAEEAIAVGEAYMHLGLEGAIIKNIDSEWKNKRVYDCLKIKGVREVELKVVGVEEGVNRNTGKLGALVCESSCGQLKVNVGTGFSDEQRAAFWNDPPIDKIITVRYNEAITSKDKKEYSLFLPRFIEIRFDKETADNLQTILGAKNI